MRIRYGEGKDQKRHTLKHRNTRLCLTCFRSEMITIIMIIVGYDNNTPFLSPCIRNAERLASTVCEKHTRVICLYFIKIRSVTKDNAIFLLICDAKK